ncbi:MAG: acetate--CoA ligase family protein, partial [Blastococcus sp.]
FVLEELDTRSSAVELIVGARRDPAFGPVVLVGIGGVRTEVYRDVQLALAPVTAEQARAMLGRLRGAPLLGGWRGAPAVDVDAAAEVAASVSRLVAEQTDVIEVEINPLRVGPDGAVAVDALVVLADAGVPAHHLEGDR